MVWGRRKRVGITDGRKLLYQLAFVLYAAATYLQNTYYVQYAFCAAAFTYMRYLAFALLMFLAGLRILDDVRRELRRGREEPETDAENSRTGRGGTADAENSRAGRGGTAGAENLRAGRGGTSDAEILRTGSDGTADAEILRTGRGGTAGAEILHTGRGGTMNAEKTQPGRQKRKSPALSAFSYEFLLLFVFVLAAAVSLRTGDRTTLYVAAFLFAGKRKYLQETLQISLILQMALLVFVILSSVVGIIPDLLIKRDVIPIRHSLGFMYPSICTTGFFFLLLLYLWLNERRMKARDLLWMEITNTLLYILTESRISFLLCSLVILAAYLFCCRRIGKLLEERLRVCKEGGGLFYRVCVWLYDFYPVLLCVFYGLLCAADQALGGNSVLDRALSGRLRYTVLAVQNYGIHLIAGPIAWVGFGGAEDTDALLDIYNFVDCSYAFLLIGYGILVFAVVLIYLVQLQKYIRRRETAWKSLLMLFVLSYCLLEPRLLEIQSNVFLLLGAPLVRKRPSLPGLFKRKEQKA